jgi:UDPglucose 6-dehydrogenase
MNITVVGTGYVGLRPARASEFGTHVTCVDNNADKIAMLKRGEMPTTSPGSTPWSSATSRRAASNSRPI